MIQLLNPDADTALGTAALTWLRNTYTPSMPVTAENPRAAISARWAELLGDFTAPTWSRFARIEHDANPIDAFIGTLAGHPDLSVVAAVFPTGTGYSVALAAARVCSFDLQHWEFTQLHGAHMLAKAIQRAVVDADFEHTDCLPAHRGAPSADTLTGREHSRPRAGDDQDHEIGANL